MAMSCESASRIVAAHSIRHRILKVRVSGGNKWVAWKVAAHSIRHRILKVSEAKQNLEFCQGCSPFDPTQDTESLDVDCQEGTVD